MGSSSSISEVLSARECPCVLRGEVTPGGSGTGGGALGACSGCASASSWAPL